MWDDISDETNFKYCKIVLFTSSELLSKIGWSSLKEKRNKQKAVMTFKIMNGMTPAYLGDIFIRNIGRLVYNLRISRRNLAPTQLKPITPGAVLLILGQKSGMHYQMK